MYIPSHNIINSVIYLKLAMTNTISHKQHTRMAPTMSCRDLHELPQSIVAGCRSPQDILYDARSQYCTHQTLSDVPCPRHPIVSPIWALVPCPQLLVALPALKMLLSKYGNVLIPGKLSKLPAHLGCTRRHARLRTRT